MTVSDLLAVVPDLPRWVETRGMLLEGNYRLLREPESADFILCRTDLPFISIVGRPPESVLKRAIEQSASSVEVEAQGENREHVAGILSGWVCESATLFRLKDRVDLSVISTHPVRFLESEAEIGSHVPKQLAKELRAAFSHVPVAATYIDGKPVSFCYAGSITETLWDVSIDTLKPYRRKGYAKQCVVFLIDWMRKQDKEPVWGSLDSNAASRNLAIRLGFYPVDHIWVFRKPG